jgi:large subunit ribosomal protein L1
MAKLTKKQKALEGKVDSDKLYPLNDALGIVKQAATAKFDESIDVAVQLGIDPKKSDQVVRGAVVMPNGTGKTKRVAVFAQGAKAEEAKAAGADIVGMDDLAARVKAGDMPFDVVIAAPDAMRVVGTLGQILGPRGLMPNPKVGTVTPDVATAVKNAKAGQVQFRADKAGIIHATLGRRSFDADKLQGNLVALIEALTKAKPASSKGVYLRKVAVSSTMGLGVRVDMQTLNAQGQARRKEIGRPARSAGVVGRRAREANRRAIQDRWRAAMPLIERANADGDPADRRIREISEDSWSLNKGARRGNPKRILKE